MKAGKPRFSIQPQGAGIAIACPAPRDVALLLIVSVWVAFWTYGGLSAFRQLFDPQQEERAFLAFWLMGWAVGEAFAIATLVWQLAGREEIVVSGGSLKHRVSMAGLGRTREYALAQVRNVRTESLPKTPRGRQTPGMLPLFGLRSGTIAFDHGARTHRIGLTLDEAESALVIAEISRRFPRFPVAPAAARQVE